MKELSSVEISDVSRGFSILLLGAAIAGGVLSFVAGGPGGLGMYVCSLVMKEGIDGMVDLSQQNQIGQNPNDRRR